MAKLILLVLNLKNDIIQEVRYDIETKYRIHPIALYPDGACKTIFHTNTFIVEDMPAEDKLIYTLHGHAIFSLTDDALTIGGVGAYTNISKCTIEDAIRFMIN